jgi:prenyl protein peptidase
MFLSPLVFGVAHVHHFFEIRITRPDVPVSLAMISSLVQLSFTSLFGTYATFVYLRTGSLLAVITIHAFCNSLGLPRFWGHVEPWWQQPWQRGARGTITSSPWLWTLPYYIFLALGASFWWHNLYCMTASRHALTLQD